METLESLSERVTPEEEVNWHVVELIVTKYTDRHHEEMAGCILHVKELRENLRTSFAELGTESHVRHIYELPTSLEMALSMKYPKLLKDENLKRFLGLFPQFQVAEKL